MTKAADTDHSRKLDVTDAIHLLGHLFLGGPAPKPPFPDMRHRSDRRRADLHVVSALRGAVT